MALHTNNTTSATSLAFGKITTYVDNNILDERLRLVGENTGEDKQKPDQGERPTLKRRPDQ